MRFRSRFYVNIGYFGWERGSENSGTAAITRPINLTGTKMNSYRRASFILQLHIWTSVTTVHTVV